MSEPRTALVTGSAKRIGAAIARDLAAHGFAIAIHCNQSIGEAEALAAEIEAGGGRAAVVRGDLADAGAVARLVPAAAASLGPLTLLVNNASVFLKDLYGGLDIGVWQTQFDVNLRAPVFLAEAFAAQLPKGLEGNIVNMIDQRVLKLRPDMPSYTLTKAALWAATQTLAQALAPKVRVNGIGPGPTFPNSLCRRPGHDEGGWRYRAQAACRSVRLRPRHPLSRRDEIDHRPVAPHRFRPAHRMGDARHRGTAVVKEPRNSVLTAVPADPSEAGGAASDIPPLAEDIGPESAPRLDIDWEATVPAGSGPDVIAAAVKTLPNAPGVYRMIDEKGDVLYVGKARSLKKRVVSYTRLLGQSSRIARMIRATVTMDFVRTRTETEALLLEANLIKRLRPRFNVNFRDDKSFPYILIAEDHDAPAIMKHRGARRRKGSYFGPFASAGAVGRTVNTLQRAFLIRTCSDAVYASRTRPCLLYQIKRCSAPCTGEIALDDYRRLVDEAKAFLSGESRQVRTELAEAMETASGELDFETAALYRDRLAALSHIQSHQGINPHGVEEADVVAVHQDGGYWSIQVFFFRTGQNWGNRAYFPKADRSLEAGAVLEAFLAQFYDDKPTPKLVLVSTDFPERALLEAALSERAGHRITIAVPQRGEKRELVEHAAANAREALARKIAETSSQAKLLAGLAEAFGLPAPPQRVEVYDNSHVMGTNAVGAMIVAGPEGFAKNHYRKFNIRADGIVPGDDTGMMREVMRRRFARLLKEAGAARRGEGGKRRARTLARSRARRWRQGSAQRRLRGPRRAWDRGPADRLDRQGARPRRRARDLLQRRTRAVHAPAPRPGALFRAAPPRRGASLRHRLAPRPAEQGDAPEPARRHCGGRAEPQAGSPSPFRHGKGRQSRRG